MTMKVRDQSIVHLHLISAEAILAIAECSPRRFPPPQWGSILIGHDANAT
jgi:hypothetical protein